MSELPQLLTVSDFCRHYSISRTSLYREIAAGRLSIRKFGSASRIARSDAEVWASQLPMMTGGAA